MLSDILPLFQPKINPEHSGLIFVFLSILFKPYLPIQAEPGIAVQDMAE
jgi:hypothetical protein